jgi:hypothetical protein
MSKQHASGVMLLQDVQAMYHIVLTLAAGLGNMVRCSQSGGVDVYSID